MKRLVWILLAVLLLTGCTAPKDNPAATEQAAEAAGPENIYMANTSVEQQTGGAVKVYVPQDGTYIGMATMNGQVVLATDLTKLILMDGETGDLGASIKVGETISLEATDFTVTDEGISFYREDGLELVFLNDQLQQAAKVEIPDGISGHPCVSHVNQEVYYTKGKEVRALHMQTGISRLVKSQLCQSIELVASHLDGTMLACRVVDEVGNTSMLYMDSATGQTLDDITRLTELQTGGTQYLVTRLEGMVQQQIYGTVDGEGYILTAPHALTAAFQMGGGYCWRMEEGTLVMDYYDFATGTHSAQVRMVGVNAPISVAADSKYIWVLAKEGDTEMLYRWDVSMSRTDNEHSYLEKLYTRDDPNTKGLAQCAQRAKELEDKYGISVHVGEDALAANGGYSLVDEFQVPVLTEMMDVMEAILSRLPENFLKNSLVKGQLHISLVRSIEGGKEMVQFYENGNAYVILAASNRVEEHFLHGIAYVIDSHVLGNSRDYDTWKNLNPEGFDYDYSYYVYKNHRESQWLHPDSRAFVDAYAMTFPHEDRCRLFVYAMMDENEDYFTTDTMQAKLQRMCQGIRESYGYEGSGETYRWEQYLAEPTR